MNKELVEIVRDAAIKQYMDALRRLGVSEDTLEQAKKRAIELDNDSPFIELAKKLNQIL